MLIALDLGGNVGIAVGRPGEKPRLRTLQLPGRVGRAAFTFEGAVRQAFREDRIIAVAYERPIAQRGKAVRNADLTCMRVFGQAWTLEKLANEYGVPTYHWPVKTLRKRQAGRGNASPIEIEAACKARKLHPRNQHEADAALVFFEASDTLTSREAA